MSIRETADNCFKSDKWEEARVLYTRLLAAPGSNNNDTSMFDHVVMSNRSQCYISMGDYENAISDARIAIMLMPSYPKAHYRLGRALFLLDRIEEAHRTCRQALELSPNDRALKQLAQSCHLKLYGGQEIDPKKYVLQAQEAHNHSHGHAHGGHEHGHHDHSHGHEHNAPKPCEHDHSHGHEHNASKPCGHDHSHGHEHNASKPCGHDHSHGHEHNASKPGGHDHSHGHQH